MVGTLGLRERRHRDRRSLGNLGARHGGDDTLRDLEAKHGPLPVTTTSITGSKGAHYVFRLPPGVTIPNSAGKIGPGLDVRGEAGFIVAPPSIHASGNSYVWELEREPEDVATADAPPWLLDFALKGASGKGPSGPLPAVIPEGERRARLLSLGGTLRKRGAEETEIRDALRAMNRPPRFPKPLPDSEVSELARDIAARYPAGGSLALHVYPTTASGAESNPVKAKSPSWPPSPPIPPEEIVRLACYPVEWLIEPLCARGQVTLFVAGPKGMKSNFATALALGAANGCWPCGEFRINAPCRVCYLNFEDGKRRVSRRLVKFAGQIPGGKWPSVWGSEDAPDVKLPRDEAKLIEWLRAERFDVLVLDVLLYTSEAEDENSSAQMQRWCASARRVADGSGTAILLLHHKRKGERGGSSVQDLARGSSTLAGLADSILYLERQDDTHLGLEAVSKDAPPARWTLIYDHSKAEPWTVEPAGEVYGARAKVLAALQQATKKTPGASFAASTVATLASLSENVAREQLKALVADGKAVESPRPGRGGGSAYAAILEEGNHQTTTTPP
ncbi:MAG: hypothetical protein FD180_4344 [Planctomycetota bacterium]|nr:MAG: hypothetical protein FD180_4344 [Planctomycetota bacterium]